MSFAALPWAFTKRRSTGLCRLQVSPQYRVNVQSSTARIGCAQIIDCFLVSGAIGWWPSVRCVTAGNATVALGARSKPGGTRYVARVAGISRRLRGVTLMPYVKLDTASVSDP
jgi:hypothetical protein